MTDLIMGFVYFFGGYGVLLLAVSLALAMFSD